MLLDREHSLTTKQRSERADGTSSLAARYAINESHRIILYTGTFEPYQGLDLLVDAAPAVIDAHRNVRLLCLGGNENQIAGMKARTQQRDVAAFFILPGTVPPEDVEPHFTIASILVSPRISGTNTPLKIYSYLRSGIPILATNILSHTQVLSPDVALLVEPRAESLAAGILRLLDETHLCQRLAQNALRLAQKSYSPETYHRKVADVFSFLAARSREASHPR